MIKTLPRQATHKTWMKTTPDDETTTPSEAIKKTPDDETTTPSEEIKKKEGVRSSLPYVIACSLARVSKGMIRE